MTGLATLLFAAAAGFTVARWLRLPAIPLLLLLGIGLSLTGFKPPTEITRHVLELGLTFLAFVSGVELSPKRLARRRRAVLTIALTQFVVTGLAGYAVASWFGVSAGVKVAVFRRFEIPGVIGGLHGCGESRVSVLERGAHSVARAL